MFIKLKLKFNMFMVRKNLWLFVVASMLMLTSCAKFPQAEYEVAKQAVADTKAVGADLYVADAYKVLVDSLQKTEITLNAEKAKWFKTYKVSKLSLAGVSNLAVEVKGKSEARKAEVIKENEALIVELADLVATDNDLLSHAPKGKDGREALAAIKADIAVVETSVGEAKALITSNDLLGANAKLKASKDKAVLVKSELEEAIAKSKSHKK